MLGNTDQRELSERDNKIPCPGAAGRFCVFRERTKGVEGGQPWGTNAPSLHRQSSQSPSALTAPTLRCQGSFQQRRMKNSFPSPGKHQHWLSPANWAKNIETSLTLQIFLGFSNSKKPRHAQIVWLQEFQPTEMPK